MALSAALGRPSPPPPSAPVDPHITPTGLHVNMVPSAAAPTPLADDSGSIKRSGPTSPGVRPDRVEAENICRPAQHLSALAGHSGSVLCVAFSPDRNILASGGLDATTRVWDFSATQPRQRALLRKHVGEVHSLVFSPDGGLLASGSGSSDGLIWVGSVVRAEPQDISFLRGHFGSVDALAFSPDGRTLASGGQDATVRIWEIAGSQSSCRTVLKGHTQPVRAVAFAPDGQVVAGAAMDGTVRLWDLSRLWSKEWAMLRHPEAVNSIAFSSEGDLLVTGSADHVVRVWDVGSANPQLLGELTDHDQPVHIVLITQDGQRLIAAGEGRRVTVWDEDGEKIQEWLVPRLMHRYLALTLDGRYLASGALDGVVHVYRIAERRPNGKPAPPS
jgi:WD40 repeat protein